MTLIVKVGSMGEEKGTISWSSDSGFVLDPPNSRLLRNVLEEPIWMPISGKLADVDSSKSPELFMVGLASHYKSYALMCTQVEDTEQNEEDEDEES